jgi:5-methylcytosine-specific restriction protein A
MGKMIKDARIKSTPDWHRWYSKRRWRKMSADQLRKEPFCRWCKEDGRVTPAEVADHIIPHGGDEQKFWLGELQSLCFKHHNSTKRRLLGNQSGHKAGTGDPRNSTRHKRPRVPIGLDGYPVEEKKE